MALNCGAIASPIFDVSWPLTARGSFVIQLSARIMQCTYSSLPRESRIERRIGSRPTFFLVVAEVVKINQTVSTSAAM